MIKRILTGLTLLGIGFFVISSGGFWFWLWVSGVSLFCVYELLAISMKPLPKSVAIVGFAVVGIAMVSVYFPQTRVYWQLAHIRFLSLTVVLLALVELASQRLIFQEFMWLSVFRSVFLVSFTCPFIFLVRELPDGRHWMFFCLVVLTASDTLALFGGKLFGRHQLSILSPKKTVEGSVIGFWGAMGIAWIAVSVGHLPVVPFMLAAVVMAVLSQVGDLHESLTKRFFQVKDSSGFLPGHGGFYDRADSYLLAMPVVFYLVHAFFL